MARRPDCQGDRGFAHPVPALASRPVLDACRTEFVGTEQRDELSAAIQPAQPELRGLHRTGIRQLRDDDHDGSDTEWTSIERFRLQATKDLDQRIAIRLTRASQDPTMPGLPLQKGA